MNKNTIIDLLPHQRAFLDEAFSPRSNKVVLLIGPTGYGKSRTFVASLAHWYQGHPESRMLFLTPTAFHDQVLELLRESGTPAFKFDRYWLRQNLDEVDSDIRLPRGAVAVANLGFAGKKDVLDILDRSSIDLVVADEAHHLGVKVHLVELLIARAEKMLLATATPSSLLVPGLLEEVTTIRWEHTDLLDVSGKPLLVEATEIRPSIGHFVRSNLEQRIQGSVESLVDLLKENPNPYTTMVASTLVKTLESSPPAFESTFTSLRNNLMHNHSRPFRNPGSQSDSHDEQYPILDPRSLPVAVNLITGIEMWLDELDHDAKLESLGRIIADIRGVARTGEVTLVITDFMATLHYLASYLEEYQIRHSVMYSQQSLNERTAEIDRAAMDTGVLIATRAVISEHLDLSSITDLIMYDPVSKGVLTDLVNSLSWRNRSPIRVHLIQSDKASQSGW